MEMDKKDKYEFKKAIEEIEDLKGRGTELISLYVPPDKSIPDVNAYLNEEMSESSNIKSKSTRKHVQSALKSISAKLKYFDEAPENGVIFFVGHVSASGDKTDMISKTIEPPQEIESFVYRCDSEFHVEPLKEMVSDRESYGLIVLDRSEATVGILKGNRVKTLQHLQSMVPSKHSKGGFSQQRFERRIKEAAQNYFKKLADKANGLLMEEDVEGVLVGGPGRTKDKFIDGDFLHYELEDKIIDTFNTSYTDEYGLKELVENAQETLSDLQVMKEKKLINELMGEIKNPNGGLATYGEEEVMKALSMGAVETLLVSEGINKQRADVECTGCDYEGTITVEGEFDPDEDRCPECDSEVEIVEKRDIIDELYEKAEEVGSEVKLISEESEEGELLMNAFGGIAALLRFRIN